MATADRFNGFMHRLFDQLREERGDTKVALHTAAPSDDPLVVRWWGEGTELAERLRALADLWRHQPGTTSYELIAIDLDGVLSGEWDPREQR
jgi:hypothetical protein